MTGRMARAVAAGLAVFIVAAVLVWCSLRLSDALAGTSRLSYDPRPTLLCVGLCGLNVVSYLAWPSRWNIVGHANLAFCLVGYVVPIYCLHILDYLDSDALNVYYRVIVVGLVAAVVGTWAGASLVRPRTVDLYRRWFPLDFVDGDERLAARVFTVAVLCVAAMVLSFAVMGFVPALATDPLTAKFFRGQYAAPYARVAPLYRAATSLLTVLLPLLAAYAWKRRSARWMGLCVIGLGCMLMGLLRGYAVTGLLLTVGVLFAAGRRRMTLYFGLLCGAYFVGAAMYAVLAAVGLGHFQSGNGASVLRQVANGAPDVQDQVHFLRAWLTWHPPLTLGRTFVGGLVPGNFPWNPSVWSLEVLNPGANISDISSGGLRLPAPIWGLVSFGWPGVLVVSFGYGLVTGYLARLASRVVPSKDVLRSVYWMVMYSTAITVLPNFYRLSYLSVGQLVVFAVLVRYGMRSTPRPQERRVAFDQRARERRLSEWSAS